MLEQEELSAKVVIMEDINNNMSESLGMYDRIIFFKSYLCFNNIYL